MKRSYFLLLMLALELMSCREEQLHRPNGNGVKPEAITTYSVENEAGKSVINYVIPDQHTAYILAEYSIREGQQRSVKSSRFKNSIIVEGFATPGDFEVTLYAVSEGEQRSDPTIVRVSPLTPPHHFVLGSLSVSPGFGGIIINGENPSNSALVIEMMVADPSSGKWEVANRHYSDGTRIRYPVRGFDNIETIFGFAVRDRWFNFSDTVFVTVTPFVEEQIDMSRFYPTIFPGDNTTLIGATWTLDKLFNKSLANPLYGTQTNSGMPQHFTLFLQDTYVLSRLKIWTRQEAAYIFAGNAPRKFRFWGSMDPAPDGSWESWTMLGEFEVTKPSGEPVGTNTEADRQKNAAGLDFDLGIDVPPLRYLRVQTLETWGRQGNIQIAEMEIYGAKSN